MKKHPDDQSGCFFHFKLIIKMNIKKIAVYLLFVPIGFSCKNRFFRSPSGSMENTILAGQTFYVEPSHNFKRNDIVVFDYFGQDYSSPTEESGKYNMSWQKRFYRLIASSGDKLEIKNGDIFVDNYRIPPPETALFQYEVRSKVSIDDFPEEYPLTIQTEKRGDTLIYTLPLSVKEARDYELRKPAIISVRRNQRSDFAATDTFFAKGSKEGNWSADDYGPLKIPSPGETIRIDSFNYKIYKNLPDVKPGNYVLKEKLYFLLGDNWYGSEDSRYIGLVPHSKMYGIVK